MESGGKGRPAMIFRADARSNREGQEKRRRLRGRQAKRKLIVFKRDMPVSATNDLLQQCAVTPIKHLPLVNALAVELEEDELSFNAKIKEHRGIVRIDDDITVQVAPFYFGLFSLVDQRRYSQIPSWGWEKIGASAARNRRLNLVKVAVVDTGIAYDHPDLAKMVAGGVNTIGPGQPTQNFYDDNGHGTHVAGIIGAVDNNIGVVGVAPNVELYGVKTLDASGTGNLSDLIEGLQWCVDNGIHLVNLSLSSSETNDTFREVIETVHRSGITLVCAAGNNGPNGSINYPAKYPTPIAVAATTETDQIATFSSRGPAVDIAAPGDKIVSTWLGGGYRALSGTSMAAPFVTGAAALIMGTLGHVSPSQMRSLLMRSTISLASQSRDAQGAGRLDITRLAGLLWSDPAWRR